MNERVDLPVTTRSTFAHGGDCRAELRPVTRDSDKARADIWHITMGSGDEFYLTMMKMRHKKDHHPWVFGSIYFDAKMKREKWSFSQNARQIVPDFIGDVFTVVGDDNCTYVVFRDMLGNERQRLLFSTLLRVPQVMFPVVDPTPEGEFMAESPVEIIATILPEPKPAPAVDVTSSPPAKRMLQVLADNSREMRQFVDDVLSGMCRSSFERSV